MRGMLNGVWYSDLKKAPKPFNGDLTPLFESTAAISGIDLQRLRSRPQSYHLYVAPACPFAHRTLLARAILDIDIPITQIDPWLGGPEGWQLPAGNTGPVAGATKLWQVYLASDPHFSGQVTVPVLWDCDNAVIANAESDEILEAFFEAFADKTTIVSKGESLAALCNWIKQRINVGIYQVGFAACQTEYDKAYTAFMEDLELLEKSLEGKNYLWNNRLSTADLYLFPTAVRFDVAYQGAFQMLVTRWRDYPNLQAHMERIAALPGIAETVVTGQYRRHYFDDGVFPLRHPGADGHYIVPRTPEPLKVGS